MDSINSIVLAELQGHSIPFFIDTCRRLWPCWPQDGMHLSMQGVHRSFQSCAFDLVVFTQLYVLKQTPSKSKDEWQRHDTKSILKYFASIEICSNVFWHILLKGFELHCCDFSFDWNMPTISQASRSGIEYVSPNAVAHGAWNIDIAFVLWCRFLERSSFRWKRHSQGWWVRQ